MPQVQVIQPIQQQPKRLRVAAYARVSSDSEDQLNSLAVQVDYYTHLIQENPNWEFAGIYTDEGITGTSTKRREQFNRLMDDCRAGLIDRVLVKSASRFARNTADALSSVRELKSLGVTVAFEKEGFDTETSNGEMLLSIICAVAQEESLSMRVLLFGKVSYYTMDTGSRIKLVREHRGLTQQKLGEMLGYGKSSANRIAQYEMGYRSPKANRLKEIAKAMNIREEIFLMPDETPIDLLRILIWYDWEHEGVLQLATSRTANTPPGKTVSPIIYSEQLPLNRLLLDWADQKHSLSVRKITRADYLEWMLQWPPRLP